MSPEAIRELRIREYASQAVFARYLNVKTSLVSQWERAEKRPRGAALNLLTLVATNGLGALVLDSESRLEPRCSANASSRKQT